MGERPGITKRELKAAAGMSGAAVALNLRRMLDRGEVHEEALPGGGAGYWIADGKSEPTKRPRGRGKGVGRRAGARCGPAGPGPTDAVNPARIALRARHLRLLNRVCLIDVR